MKRFILSIFILASVGELASTFIDFPTMHLVCKPLIMVALGLYYYLSVSNENRSVSVLAAIVFSLAGDILLMLHGYFMEGLIAFLISHVLYIIAYRQHRDEQSKNILRGVHSIRLAFPIILAGTGLVIILYPSLGNMKIPVVVYAIVLSSMVLSALFRFGKTNATSFWMVFLGAVLFMISDSILAIDKFLSPLAYSSLWIMLTYIIAQFLIVQGLLKHNRD